MPDYTSGSAALADARLRADALGRNQGVLMLEGRDDVIVFANRVESLQSVVACGNKRILREAFESSRSADRARILFVADCDYDVPAGKITPGNGLLLTKHTDREADFVQLGIVRGIALRAIPRSRKSETAADAIASDIFSKAIELAEVAGQLRYIAATSAMPLNFKELELRRYRDKKSGAVKLDGLIDAIRQRSPRVGLDIDALRALMDGAPVGVEVCHGKDLIQAITAVIHQDYGVKLSELAYVPELFRSVEDSVFEAWEVVRRIRAWEDGTGISLLG